MNEAKQSVESLTSGCESNNRQRVGIVGATGYTGLLLIQILVAHPHTEIVYLAANRSSGQSIFHVFPQLMGMSLPETIVSFDPNYLPPLDILFLALPHGQSHMFMKTLIDSTHIGRIIDLSADFRLSNAALFKQHYGLDHGSESLLGTIPLGIPELYDRDIQEARVVACPGCYSTSVILGLYPLVQADLLKETVIVDSKSGVSGAGRKVVEGTSYCEVNESVTAYATGYHRHSAEIEQTLASDCVFSPHLVPMMRGILSSCYVNIQANTDCLALYQEYYHGMSFIRLSDDGDRLPSTKTVVGSNYVDISFRQLSSKQWVVFVAIDNLVKGAAGQAVQVMNHMMGWTPTVGLVFPGRYL